VPASETQAVIDGDKDIPTTGTHGEVTRLLRVEKMKNYKLPPPWQPKKILFLDGTSVEIGSQQ
jgi:hypothetical protein